jgi:hypothetical protein
VIVLRRGLRDFVWFGHFLNPPIIYGGSIITRGFPAVLSFCINFSNIFFDFTKEFHHGAVEPTAGVVQRERAFKADGDAVVLVYRALRCRTGD